jgi:hypothetical protein
VSVVFNLNKILSNLNTTPSAPERRLRDILWMSRPPLLGEEGKIADQCVWATAPFGRGYDLSPLRGSNGNQYVCRERSRLRIHHSSSGNGLPRL